MAETPPPQPTPSPEKSDGAPQRLDRPSLWRSKGVRIAAAIGVVLLTVTSLLLLALRHILFPSAPSGMPLEITRFPLSPLPSPPAPVVEVGDTQVLLPVPAHLAIEEYSFPVRSAMSEEEAAALPADPDSAVWFYGTVVNYVLGLEATEENQALVEQLELGDPIRLRLSNGTRLLFRVVQREEARPDDPTLFAQSRPGLTLMLLEEGGEKRPVVFADFDTVEESSSPTGGTAVPVGQPVRVEDVQVTVVKGHAEVDAEALPSGTLVYLVEFSVQNTGSSPLDTTEFLMELTDGMGNLYQPSPSFSDLGEYGPLPREIPPGEEVSGTVAYVVPEELAGPAITWTFGVRPDSELRARFTIPYVPSATPTAQPEVGVLEAFLGEGKEVLHIVAEIYNPGEAPLTVSADDITFSSSAGPGELILAAPPFPWVIEAGETREVELEFARPEASSAIVTILGYTFEISGLP